jgi:hypothetical protein
MSEPHPLYVDEISPDQVKAVVSNVNSVYANFATMRSAMGWASVRAELGVKIKGVYILPLGRYVCMVTSTDGFPALGGLGMVLLDLADRVDIGYKIAEQLNNKELEERFIDVLAEIVWHPERHQKFKLVVGQAPRKLFH